MQSASSGIMFLEYNRAVIGISEGPTGAHSRCASDFQLLCLSKLLPFHPVAASFLMLAFYLLLL
jgi:hypothetical protein